MKAATMARNEKRWVAWYSIGLAVLTSLPYLLALIRGPQTFTGFLIGVEDGNSYIAKMLAGATGDWLFRSPYSTQPQIGALLYLPYILLGKMLGPGASHLAYVLAFHALRIAAVSVLCFAVYAFMSQFVNEVRVRRLGLLLATLGGGLGWFLLALGQPNWLGSMPLDFYSPEAFGYLAIFSLPHLILARAFLLLAILQFLHQLPSATTVLLWAAMALTHLLTAGLALLLLGVYFLVSTGIKRKLDRPQLHTLLLAALGVLPVALLNAYIFSQDVYLQAWSNQNQILSPHPLHYVLAYGLLIPFVALALKEWRKDQLKLLSLTWLLLLPVLLYAPVGLQRRLSEGVWVLLVALALRFFQANWMARRRWLWVLLLTLPSTVILWLGSIQVAWAAAPPVQRSPDEAAVFAMLGQRVEPGEVVLAAYSTGNALPAWAPLRVVAGHGPETINSEEMLELVAAFYSPQTRDSVRLQILQDQAVDYVLWGPHERSLGDFDLTQAPYLQAWFGVGAVQVFQVVQH